MTLANDVVVRRDLAQGAHESCHGATERGSGTFDVQDQHEEPHPVEQAQDFGCAQLGSVQPVQGLGERAHVRAARRSLTAEEENR